MAALALHSIAKKAASRWVARLRKTSCSGSPALKTSRQGVPLTLTPFGNSVTVQSPNNNLLYSAKVDYKISENNLLTMRYAVDRFRSANVIVQTGLNVTPDDLTSSTINNASFNVGLVSTLRPTLINEARFVFYRFVSTTADNSTVPGVIHPDGTQTGADFCCPQGGLQKRYQYIDNMTWSHGTHTSKFGFNISYYPWNSLFPQFHFGQYVANAGRQRGIVPTFTIAFGPGEVTSKDNIYGFYAQDTWKLTRKLTMNAGLRWDYEAGAFKGGKIHGRAGLASWAMASSPPARRTRTTSSRVLASPMLRGIRPCSMWGLLKPPCLHSTTLCWIL